MNEYKSQKDLYLALIPAFNVKLRLLKKNKCDYIKNEDIWNYLKITKWQKSYGLTVADMVNDIVHVEEGEIVSYLQEKLKKEEKELYFD